MKINTKIQTAAVFAQHRYLREADAKRVEYVVKVMDAVNDREYSMRRAVKKSDI